MHYHALSFGPLVRSPFLTIFVRDGARGNAVIYITVSNITILFCIKLTLPETKVDKYEKLVQAVDKLSTQMQNERSDLSSSGWISDTSRARSKVLGLLDQIAISLKGPNEFIQGVSRGVRLMMCLLYLSLFFQCGG